MKFEGDAFISYAHLDNIGLSEGHKGWVANLHRALEIRLAQLLGKQSEIWWDPKLQGNDVFSETLIAQLRRVASLVSVISPRYVKSEWGRKELTEFCKAATQQGGLRIQDKARIFKVLKTPVPLEHHPPELQSLLGYEFFKVDPDTGRCRELDEIFGPEAEKDFWLKLDDLAHDMCGLLEMLDTPALPAAPANAAVFLADTTGDLREQHEAIKRDLQQHDHVVLPARALPLSAPELTVAVREDLARCRMSIHMIGKTYSLVPEGGMQSLLEIQNELAIERAKTGSFSRLVWIPPGVQVNDERQRKVVEQLRMDQRIDKGADLLETPLEDLRTVIATWLKRDQAPPQRAASGPTTVSTSPHLYFIYDTRDADVVTPWADFLFKDFEVVQPVFTGDEADVREYHEENLRTCDGTLIFYGAANECWLRRKLAELQKSAGYGRTKPMPVVAICLAPPQTAEKARFRTHAALVISQWDGFSPDPLQPFVSALKARGEEREGDATGHPV
jgi:hypothetical protein